MGKQLRQQLEQHGLDTSWFFPVLMCQELQSAVVLPVFLTHDGLVATWQACGKEGPPPSKLQVMDMRILAGKMLAPYKETGFDANIIRFLGSETGWDLVKGSRDKLEAGESGQPSDPSDEPPPLEGSEAAQTPATVAVR